MGMIPPSKLSGNPLPTDFQRTTSSSLEQAAGCCLWPAVPGSAPARSAGLKEGFFEEDMQETNMFTRKNPANMVVNHGKPVVRFFLERKWPQKNTNYESIISSYFIHPFWIRILQDFSRQIPHGPATAAHLVLRTAAAVETLRKARPRRQGCGEQQGKNMVPIGSHWCPGHLVSLGNGCSSLVVYSVFKTVLTHPHSWFLDEFVCSSIDVLRRPSSIYFTWGLISTSGSSISWGVVISATRHSVQPQKSLAMVGWAWTEAKSGTSMVQWCVPLKDWTKIEQMGSQKKKLKNMDETVPVIPVLGIQKASILALDIQGTSSASSGLSSSKKPAVGLSQWVQNSPFAPSKCSNNQHSWVGNGV